MDDYYGLWYLVETNTLQAGHLSVSSAPLNAQMTTHLSNEYTTAMLTNYTRADFQAVPPISVIGWGSGWTHRITIKANELYCLNETNNVGGRTNACRLISGDESSNMLTRLSYRIGVTNSTTGIVYRATVAHVFTPTNAGAPGVVITVTNLLGKGNGRMLYLDPTNGIAIDPPASNGTSRMEIILANLLADSDNDGTLSQIDDEIEMDSPGLVLFADKDQYWLTTNMIVTAATIHVATTWPNNKVPEGLYATLEWIEPEDKITQINLFTDPNCSTALSTMENTPVGHQTFGKGHIFTSGDTIPATVYIEPSMAWWTNTIQSASSQKLRFILRDKNFVTLSGDVISIFPCNTAAVCPKGNSLAIWREETLIYTGEGGGDLEYQSINETMGSYSGDRDQGGPYHVVVYKSHEPSASSANFMELRKAALLMLNAHGQVGRIYPFRSTNHNDVIAWASSFHSTNVACKPYSGGWEVEITSAYFEANWRSERTANNAIYFGVSCHGSEANPVFQSIADSIGGAYSIGTIGVRESKPMFNEYASVLRHMRSGCWRTAAGAYQGMQNDNPQSCGHFAPNGLGKVTLWPALVKDGTNTPAIMPMNWHSRGSLIALFDTRLESDLAPIIVDSGDIHFYYSTPTWWNGNAALRWYYDRDPSQSTHSHLRLRADRCFTPWTGASFAGKLLSGDGIIYGSDYWWEF